MNGMLKFCEKSTSDPVIAGCLISDPKVTQIFIVNYALFGHNEFKIKIPLLLEIIYKMLGNQICACWWSGTNKWIDSNQLTHCDPVMPYGLPPIWHQAITWTKYYQRGPKE